MMLIIGIVFYMIIIDDTYNALYTYHTGFEDINSGTNLKDFLMFKKDVMMELECI